MVIVSLDSPSCEVTLFDPVYRWFIGTRQAKGLYRLKHVGALGSGLAYLSRYNLGWFCHTRSLLPCIRTRLRKWIESAVSPASRVGPAPRYSFSDRLALRSCSFRARQAITIAFASPSFLPARRPSCILQASELASSIRPLLRHQRSPWRS
jgi:hypothetical protein